MTVSVRLPSRTEKLLREAQKRLGKTKSAVITEAIEQFCEKALGGGATLYDRVSHLVGSVHSGVGTLSQNAGRQMRERLRARRSHR